MISVITSGMESRVYLDNEGIDDMIHYLTYLREKNETTYDLIEGNELDRLDEDLVLEGFEHITHLELIYINAFDRDDGTVRIIEEDNISYHSRVLPWYKLIRKQPICIRVFYILYYDAKGATFRTIYIIVDG